MALIPDEKTPEEFFDETKRRAAGMPAMPPTVQVSTEPAPHMVPMAGAAGQLDLKWLPGATLKIPIELKDGRTMILRFENGQLTGFYHEGPEGEE